MIDRREILTRAAMLMGGAISSGAVAAVLGGCTAMPQPDGPVKTTFLNPAEMKTATAIADQIIPRTDTPGAIDVGVPAYMDKCLAGFYQDKERGIVRAGLMRADKDAMTAHGKTFSDLSSDDQVALMKVYDKEAYEQNRKPGAAPHFFRVLKELTLTGFCTSQVGATKFLKYAASPGPFRGDIPYSEVGKAWAT